MKKHLLFKSVCLALFLALLTAGFGLNGVAWSQPVSNVHVLARGAAIHGTNGLYFGPDGNLYIASFVGGDIVVMNPDNGRILRHIQLEQGMDGPDDLTFGPDGSLYWTSIATGQVGKMAPDGTQSLVAQLPPGVNPITFSADGRLFVALDFLGDALYEVYLDGVTPPRLILENLGFLNAFDFGPDGYLYGPIYTQGKFVKIDVDTGEMWDVATGFVGAAAAKFDSYGRLHVLDAIGEVFRLDVNTGERQLIASLPPGLDNLAFDENGRLFVSNSEDGFIFRVLPNGKGLPISRGGMIAPGGVAVLPGDRGQDRVFIGDFWTLRQFNGRTGKEVSVEREEMWAVHTIAPDGANLLVSSWMDNAVYSYDPVAGSVIDARMDFFGPMNAIRFQGDLIVSELNTGSVVRSTGPGDRQVLATLGLPIGLAASDDDLWVADWAIGAVFQLVHDGVPVVIPVAFGLAAPEGLAVLPNGNLLVVEGGAGRVSQINPATGEVTPFAEGLALGGLHLTGMPPFYVFNGIAVSQTGTVYVTGDEANVLYRIDTPPAIYRSR